MSSFRQQPMVFWTLNHIQLTQPSNSKRRHTHPAPSEGRYKNRAQDACSHPPSPPINCGGACKAKTATSKNAANSTAAKARAAVHQHQQPPTLRMASLTTPTFALATALRTSSLSHTSSPLRVSSHSDSMCFFVNVMLGSTWLVTYGRLGGKAKAG